MRGGSGVKVATFGYGTRRMKRRRPGGYTSSGKRHKIAWRGPTLNHERAPDLALKTATAECRLGRPKTQIRIIGPLIHGDAPAKETVMWREVVRLSGLTAQ